MANSGYKYHIEQALLKLNWEIKSIESSNVWWDDEHWFVQHQYQPELSFFVCFIVDPAYEKPRKKGQGIYEVKAATEFPKNWNDHEHTIASISMTKRKFDLKLNEFIRDIVAFIRGRTK